MEIRSILVPLSGQGLCEYGIHLACTLAKRSEATVYVTYVIQLDRTLSLDTEAGAEIRKAEELLGRARDLVVKEGCEVEAGILQARDIGPAIVDEAVERGVDVILIGMEYERRFGEFTLGEVTPHVLQKAPCSVLVTRDPPPADVPQ